MYPPCLPSIPTITTLQVPCHLLCNSKLTPLSQHQSPLPKRRNTHHTKHHQTPQQTNTPINPNPLKHRLRHQNRHEGQQAPCETVRSKNRCRVPRVNVRNVQEDTLHDNVDAEDDERKSKGRHDPVNIRAGCPGVEEKPNGNEWRGDDAGNQVVFEFAEGALCKTGENAIFEPQYLRHKGD